MDQDNSQLIDYEELVAKAVRAEAKAGLRPSSYVRETDLSCLRGNRPAHTTAHKVQTQGAGKDHRGDDSKASKGSASTPASASIQDSEPSDKAKKDKKKNWRGKRDFREPKDSTTPAFGVNAAEVGRGGQRRKNKKDISGVTCYNCNKKGHFLNKCPETPKNEYRSWQPPRRCLVLERRLWNAFRTSTIWSSSKKIRARLWFRLWSTQEGRSMPSI